METLIDIRLIGRSGGENNFTRREHEEWCGITHVAAMGGADHPRQFVGFVRKPSMNACVSSQVGSRPEARTSSKLGPRHRGRTGSAVRRPPVANRFPAPDRLRKSCVRVAGCIPPSTDTSPSNRLAMPGIRVRGLRRGKSSCARCRRAAPSPTVRMSVSPPGCRRRRRIPRRARRSRTWPGSAVPRRNAVRAVRPPMTPSNWPAGRPAGDRRRS